MVSNDLLNDTVHIERLHSPITLQLPRDTVVLAGPRWTETRDKGQLLTQAESMGCRRIILSHPSATDPWHATLDSTGQEVDLRDPNELFTAVTPSGCAVIDLNSLGLSIWAPTLRALGGRGCKVLALYMRPTSYQVRQSTVGPVYSPEYDFNARALGVRPVAGFARLAPTASQAGTLLVALLGLEGKRARVALRELGDPAPETRAVFASPGYSRRLVQRAIWAHREFLTASDSQRYVSYASPTNPFMVQRLIQNHIDDHPDRHVFVMPLATKPMNLGAVLACLRNPKRTELVFDHSIVRSASPESIDSYYIFDVTSVLAGAGPS